MPSPKGRCLRFFFGKYSLEEKKKKKKHHCWELQLGTKKGASAASRLDVMQLDSSRWSLRQRRGIGDDGLPRRWMEIAACHVIVFVPRYCCCCAMLFSRCAVVFFFVSW